MKMFGKIKLALLAAVAAVTGFMATAAQAAGESALVTAAQTETANTKADLLSMGGVIIVVVIAMWGIFKLIGMFRR